MEKIYQLINQSIIQVVCQLYFTAFFPVHMLTVIGMAQYKAVEIYFFF